MFCACECYYARWNYLLSSVLLEVCINLTLGLVFTEHVAYGDHVIKAEGLLLSSDHQYLHIDRSQSDLQVVANRNQKLPAAEAGHGVTAVNGINQCFSTAGPRPGTGPWNQLYRAARGSPGICHFGFLSIFHE